MTRRRATVLADGRFLHMSAMPGWEAGLEVWVVLPPEQGPSIHLRRVAVAVLGAAVAIGSGAFLFVSVASAQVAAVVSVDVNPSVQLGVNRSGIVVSAAPMDEEAASLLAQGGLAHHLVHHPLADAVSLIVQRAVADGYLPAGTAASIVQVPPAQHPAGGSASGSGAGSTTGAARGGTTTSPPAAPAQPASAGTVILTVAPKGAASLPPAVAHDVADTPAAVSDVLSRQGVHAEVDVISGDPSLIRQASSSRLSLTDQVFYDALANAGAPVKPTMFKGGSLDKALAAAGIPKDDQQTVVRAVVSLGADSAKIGSLVQAARHGASPAELERLLGGPPAKVGPASGASTGTAGHGGRGGSRTTPSTGGGTEAGGGGDTSPRPAGGGGGPVQTVPALAAPVERTVPPAADQKPSKSRTQAAPHVPAQASPSAADLLRRLEQWLTTHHQTARPSGGGSGHGQGGGDKHRGGSSDHGGSGGGHGGAGQAAGGGAGQSGGRPPVSAGRPPGNQARRQTSGTGAGGATPNSGFAVSLGGAAAPRAKAG